MGKQKQKEKSSNGRLIAGIVLIVVAVVVLVVVGVVYYYQNQEEETTATTEDANQAAYIDLLDRYYTSMLEGDGESLAHCMAPDAYWDYYMETYSKTEEEVIATYDDACVNTITVWEESYGEGISLEYEIIGTSTPDEDGINEWNTNIEIDALAIQDAITLQVELTVTGSVSGNVLIYYPTLAKMDGEWYILEENSETLTVAE
ncbi:MAG: hypothetical protein LUF89_03525 [Ruminococcus sp.]|nr:hypothetical protein [Ruminococcus sp.]